MPIKFGDKFVVSLHRPELLKKAFPGAKEKFEQEYLTVPGLQRAPQKKPLLQVRPVNAYNRLPNVGSVNRAIDTRGKLVPVTTNGQLVALLNTHLQEHLEKHGHAPRLVLICERHGQRGSLLSELALLREFSGAGANKKVLMERRPGYFAGPPDTQRLENFRTCLKNDTPLTYTGTTATEPKLINERTCRLYAQHLGYQVGGMDPGGAFAPDQEHREGAMIHAVVNALVDTPVTIVITGSLHAAELHAKLSPNVNTLTVAMHKPVKQGDTDLRSRVSYLLHQPDILNISAPALDTAPLNAVGFINQIQSAPVFYPLQHKPESVEGDDSKTEKFRGQSFEAKDVQAVHDFDEVVLRDAIYGHKHTPLLPYSDKFLQSHPHCRAWDGTNVLAAGRDTKVRRFPDGSAGDQFMVADGRADKKLECIGTKTTTQAGSAIYDAPLEDVIEAVGAYRVDTQAATMSYQVKGKPVASLFTDKPVYKLPHGKWMVGQTGSDDNLDACEEMLLAEGKSRNRMALQMSSYGSKGGCKGLPDLLANLKARSGNEPEVISGKGVTMAQSIQLLQQGTAQHGACILLMHGHARVVDGIRDGKNGPELRLRDPTSLSCLKVKADGGAWDHPMGDTAHPRPSTTGEVIDWDAVFLPREVQPEGSKTSKASKPKPKPLNPTSPPVTPSQQSSYQLEPLPSFDIGGLSKIIDGIKRE